MTVGEITNGIEWAVDFDRDILLYKKKNYFSGL